MKTIRRLYIYAVALIGVEVVLWGTVGLLRSIFKIQDIVRSPSELAQALALILVGTPIFLIHWLMAQKAAAKDEEDRSSTLRALFLYGILFATLVAAAQNMLALINRSILQAAHLSGGLAVVGGTQSWGDNLIAILANLATGAYFYSILRANRGELVETEHFDEVRRLYRIIWVLYSLILTIFGTQQSLSFALSLPSSVLGSIGRETALGAVALLVLGTPIWAYAWNSFQAVLPEADEQESYLRLGFLYLLSMLGLIATMFAAGMLLYQVILRLLGQSFLWSDFQKDISGLISIGVPMAVLWTYYRHWLSHQIFFDGDLSRRAGKWRLSIYLRSLMGLVAVIAGLLSLISVLTSMILGTLYLGSQGLREPLAGSFASLAIGVLVWLPAWREAQAQSFLDDRPGDNARHSLIRKVFLYLVIFGSVIGVMVSAGMMIFSLVNSALGGNVNELLKTVFQNIANLLIFAMLLYYHFTTLRTDGTTSADALSIRQAGCRVLVLDSDGSFGPSVQEAFSRRQLHYSVEIADVNQPIPEKTADIVLLTSALALTLPEHVRKWLQAYSGSLIITGNPSAREIWAADLEQAAEATRAIFEGNPQDARKSHFKTSVWTYVAYICAALFGIEMLFMLLTMAISLVFNR
jgi:hypothetical protein